MKRFYVQNNQILAGPFDIKPTLQKGPDYLYPGEWGLGDKTPERLLELGWLPEEVIGFEPFSPATQIRTGPVRTIQAGKVVSTYAVTDKTAQQIEDEKTASATSGLATALNKTLFDALWELHQGAQPTETKAQYRVRLIQIYKGYLQ